MNFLPHEGVYQEKCHAWEAVDGTVPGTDPPRPHSFTCTLKTIPAKSLRAVEGDLSSQRAADRRGVL